MSVNAASSIQGATDRGTKVVKQGNEMDKNAFLRILTTELSNQNPENANDSTQYVAQLAQFSSLEQMSNLNSTVQMSSANSLIGKYVALSKTDLDGLQYTGTVQSVTKSGSNVILNVQVNNNGKAEMMKVDYSDITDVADSADELPTASSQSV